MLLFFVFTVDFSIDDGVVIDVTDFEARDQAPLKQEKPEVKPKNVTENQKLKDNIA